MAGGFYDMISNSSFNRKLTSTSAYLLKEVCDRLRFPIEIDYLYQDEDLNVIIGEYSYIIGGVRIKRLEEGVYYCYDLDLIPNVDYIMPVGGSSRYLVTSVVGNIFSVEGNLLETLFSVYYYGDSIKVDVYRKGALLSKSRFRLLSTLQVVLLESLGSNKEEILRRLVDRLTPCRCTSFVAYIEGVYTDSVMICDNFLCDTGYALWVNSVDDFSEEVHVEGFVIDWWDGATVSIYVSARGCNSVGIVDEGDAISRSWLRFNTDAVQEGNHVEFIIEKLGNYRGVDAINIPFTISGYDNYGEMKVTCSIDVKICGFNGVSVYSKVLDDDFTDKKIYDDLHINYTE